MARGDNPDTQTGARRELGIKGKERFPSQLAPLGDLGEVATVQYNRSFLEAGPIFQQ